MRVTALLFALLLAGLAAGAYAGDPESEALRELNALRRQAGMDGFGSDVRLAAAARAHARYLLAQPGAGHFERRDGTGFTGVEPLDRARAEGYPAMLVSENIAQGNSEPAEALDGLMAAIYHRFGFLDFDMDGVGVGYAEFPDRPSSAAYVFVMSNEELAALCKGKNFEGAGRYVYSVCVPDIRIQKSVYEAARAKFGRQQPEVVLWPPDGADDVPPAFFDESPDPLPDIEVSGYPISVSVNPYRITQVKVGRFHLTDLDRGEAIDALRRLDRKSDPNHKLDAHEVAWFPLERLRWGGRYRVEVELDLDGRRSVRTWQFRVRRAPQPLYTYRDTAAKRVYVTDATGWATIYVPPDTHGVTRLTEMQFRYPEGARVTSEFLDGNTVRVHVAARVGTRVQFQTPGGLDFQVVVGDRS